MFFLKKIFQKKLNVDEVEDLLFESGVEPKFADLILEKIKPFLANRAIIIFDELYNFPGWDVGEYKALNEVFNENEYKFLSFAKNGQQAVIQLI